MKHTPREKVRPARVIVVTGGIGAGKSAFCRMVVSCGGVRYLDADLIAHEALKDPAVREEVIGHFGEEICGPDGVISRQRLGALVFRNENELRVLERILHPWVQEALAREVERLKQTRGVAIVLVEIPLLIETGIPSWCDSYVSIEAPRAIRLARLRGKGIPAKVAEPRIARQVENAGRRAGAVLVIHNKGDRRALQGAARRCWRQWAGRE